MLPDRYAYRSRRSNHYEPYSDTLDGSKQLIVESECNNDVSVEIPVDKVANTNNDDNGLIEYAEKNIDFEKNVELGSQHNTNDAHTTARENEQTETTSNDAKSYSVCSGGKIGSSSNQEASTRPQASSRRLRYARKSDNIPT